MVTENTAISFRKELIRWYFTIMKPRTTTPFFELYQTFTLFDNDAACKLTTKQVGD
jgi:hypothetical protein